MTKSLHANCHLRGSCYSHLAHILVSTFIVFLYLISLITCIRRPTIKIGNSEAFTTRTSVKPAQSQFDTYSEVTSNQNVQKIVFGAILPATALKTVQRAYNKSLQDAVDSLTKGKFDYKFKKYFRISNANVVLMSFESSPTDILQNLCQQLLPNGVSTILYMTNSDSYGHNIAAAQYLTQLTSYLGIPMIAWNADNSGCILNQRDSEALILQLAPSLKHQASAMLNILRRYSWHVFSIVTTSIGGHDNFVRAIRDQILSFTDIKFNILDILITKSKSRVSLKEELEPLLRSEARVILLHSNKLEAQEIMAAATSLKLTGRDYIWIVTQSVVGMTSEYYAPGEFPSGMLGIHFNATHSRLLEEIDRAVNIIGNGLELFISDVENINKTLSHNLTCNGSREPKWDTGDLFFKYLRKVKIKSKYGKPSLEFNRDGTLKYVELDVMNLNTAGIWEKIGTWTEQGLEIKDITWPDNSPVPPQGLPEKFNLRVTFLEEPPFVNMVPPDEETGECKSSKAVRCRYAPDAELVGVNLTLAYRNPKYFRCCSGFCIDLLEKFANELKFSYELSRVEDGKWGDLNNRTWNGLIAELLEQKADVVVTSIKINSDRQAYVDFTVPFLETGITIIVAKRTGIISPKAFLEPFDTISWIMILLISIQIAAFAIFLFEWLSPSGYNMGMRLPREQKFSLFRTYWLVWAVLFGAAVPINCPKGYTARFMSNVWATFAVVFLAIYTANLAAFMITREDYHDFSGIEDSRLANPHIHDPPLRYGTLPSGNTDAVLKRYKPKMHSYMRKYNRSSLCEGVKSVKKGELDAFIYDAVVLDYLRGQDNDCRLVTVGTWYAMTGYGFAFPKNSKYLLKFNEKMIEFRENGDLERLQKFWFQGSCKPGKNKGKLSKPLDVNQFMSAFLLLGCGILLTILLLALEHFYFRYCRKHLSKTDKDGCFTLVSLSMAKSLSTQNSLHAYSKNDFMSREDRILKIKKELKTAKSRIIELEAQLEHFKNNSRLIEGRDKAVIWNTSNQINPCPNRTNVICNHILPNDPGYHHEDRKIRTMPRPTDEAIKKYGVAEIQTIL